jgi:hypothetical protein
MNRSKSTGRWSALQSPLATLVASAALLAGCGGGGGEAGASTVPATVVVTGTVTFDRVPVAGAGLDYTGVEAHPAQGVTVQALAGETVLDSVPTNAFGRYSLTVPGNVGGLRIRALAEMRRTGAPSWAYRVVDNTDGDALYVLESAPLSIRQPSLAVDLHAASGWGGTSYSATRAAAPFAILDVVREVTGFVLAAAPETQFPPLALHWSPNNAPSRGADGAPDFISGEIGTSLFRPDVGIFLLGAEDSDTDEYDRHVIAHEWAHYLEHALGRSDSIGGPHTRGDQLDMRTAFSEGFANAFSAMALGDTRYVDVLGPRQSRSFAFDIEGPFSARGANPHPGWFSEESIQEIVYDLFDDNRDVPEDVIALGFAPLLDVLADELRQGAALTSIFAFADALRTRRPELRFDIDALLAAHAIGPFDGAYGEGEPNAGSPLEPLRAAAGDVLPVYKAVDIGGRVNVCSTDAYNYDGETGYYNKLGTRAFVRFAAPAVGTYRFAATTTDMPPGETADPDLVLHGAGMLHRSDDPPDEALCRPDAPEGCTERFERFLGPGDYVLEVYEWTNTQAADADHPPIGRTCFDVEVSLR